MSAATGTLLRARGQGCEELVCGRPSLEDGALGRIRARAMAASVPFDRSFTVDEGEPPLPVARDAALAPALAAPDELPDGKRVDELVGDDDQRTFRHIFKRAYQ